MSSVFKKLISREFGENNYNKYFFVCQKGLHNKILDNKEIYNDIYEKLKNKDKTVIEKMQGRLNDSIMLTLRISKTYFLYFIYVLGAIFFLITKQINPFILSVSIIAIVVVFLAKTYEFIVNKYCFIDAHIVLIYKTVLEKMSVTTEVNRRNRL
ncbi:MAG: hypothetical protein K0S61_1149 [Anaerocolumna sp.]|jgi:hypothetical protein|nr:hypothetical protein [Anaerocolumna sp.]